MIIITGKIEVTAAAQQAFRALAETQVTNSRTEDACLSYHYYEDAMSPGTFFFYEQWRDEQGVKFHFSQDYCRQFVAGLGALGISSAAPSIMTAKDIEIS
jgi:quinol monooxygenase YgiN